MTSRSGNGRGEADHTPSKDLSPLPDNFASTFFQNQFRTTIELPSKERFPGVNGQCAIITGSNTGLGYEASKQFLALGLSRLVMGVRSIDRGNAAAAKLRAIYSSAEVDVWALDMESYDSIQAFVRKCKDDLPRIDFVILNAGLASMLFNTTAATGHEKTIQVNHISTALLSILLLPVLKDKSDGHKVPRLTIINSVTAHLCKFPNRNNRPLLSSFDDIAITPWDPNERYGVSKLLSQLFLVRLAEKIDPNDVVINMVDPGLTKSTGLARETRGLLTVAVKVFHAVAGRPVTRGAATYIDAVSGHGKEAHGCFLMNCSITPLARWYYTEGKALTDAVWLETLEELDFAGVDGIVASMRAQSVD